jgi:hypothetical protein
MDKHQIRDLNYRDYFNITADFTFPKMTSGIVFNPRARSYKTGRCMFLRKAVKITIGTTNYQLVYDGEQEHLVHRSPTYTYYLTPKQYTVLLLLT